MRENNDVTEQEAISIIAANIRATRNYLRWSQGELAERVGTTQNMVSRWEKGEAEVTAGSLVRIANAFDIPVTSLFEPRKDLPSSTSSQSTKGHGRDKTSRPKKASTGKQRAA